jgi:NADPH:quinone reductase-like Zn-dependent oxidoreductase
MDIPNTQQQYQLIKQARGFSLQLREGAPVRRPGDGEVLVRVRASSLNRRDVMIAKGFYPVGSHERLVPLSDGAGEVVAVGHKTKRFKVGDHVAAIFFQGWLSGRSPEGVSSTALGGALDGMLAQYVTLNEQGLVAIPPGLSFEEAATLPCAAVTAWSGLVRCGRVQAGDTVLLQGTGGVSVFGLQIALAMGARPIITSSSDAKLERARKLGAIGVINYQSTPDWEKAAREMTGGLGVTHVLEVGGSGTLARSLAAISMGGHIALIGGDIPAVTLIGRNASASGIIVGSRADFEALNVFIQQHHVRPVIDRSFEFFNAESAFEYMDQGGHFGKVVIRH